MFSRKAHFARVRLLHLRGQQRRNKLTDACQQIEQHHVFSYCKIACIQNSIVLRAQTCFFAKQFIIYNTFIAVLRKHDATNSFRHARCFTPATKHVCLSTSALSFTIQQKCFHVYVDHIFSMNSSCPLEVMSFAAKSGTVHKPFHFRLIFVPGESIVSCNNIATSSKDKPSFLQSSRILENRSSLSAHLLLWRRWDVLCYRLQTSPILQTR